jgi:NitT/TauT family transport system permease protein
MFVVILAYDQLLFRPAVAWATKFRVELSAAQQVEESWVLRIFQRARGVQMAFAPVGRLLTWLSFRRLSLNVSGPPAWAAGARASRILDVLWLIAIGLVVLASLNAIYGYVTTTLSFGDLAETIKLTLYTMIRVVTMLLLATLFWVPICVWIGLRPAVAERLQPLAQFLAAFPVNVLFPIAVFLILRYRLNPDVWLSALIVSGTQWYIVFNVIAGTAAFPNDLREAAANFGAKGWGWWRDVILPGIFPYYVTGALTASGGSWNASIVAEYVRWGQDKVEARGIGSYIAKATEAGDYPKIVLGVAVMSAFVIAFNRLLWRPLFGYAERRLRLS